MTDKNKADIAKLLLFAMNEQSAADAAESAKVLAHDMRMIYDAYIGEGFTKGEAMHMIDVLITAAVRGLGKQ